MDVWAIQSRCRCPCSLSLASRKRTHLGATTRKRQGIVRHVIDRGDCGSRSASSAAFRRRQIVKHFEPAAAGHGITEGVAARPILGREGAYRRSLAVADTAAALGALGAVALVGNPRGAAILLAFAPLIVLINKLAGLYDRDELVMNKTTLDEAPALLQLSGLFTLLVWMGHDAVVRWGLDPSSVLVLWSVMLGLSLTGRTAARRLASSWTEPERCLVIGSMESAETLTEKLASSNVRASVVARVPLDADGGVASVTPDDLPSLVRRYDVHRVVIAPLASDAGDMLELIRVAKAAGVRVSVMPRMLEVVGSSVEFDHIDGLTMLGVRSLRPPAVLACAQARVRPGRRSS